VPLSRAALEAGVALRTAQRWLARHRAGGLVGLARPVRSDRGRRRTHPELVRLIEGLALTRPAPSSASIARRAAQTATTRGWPVPVCQTVHAIVRDLDPALLALAQEGADAYRDRYELVLRRQAKAPNEIWQADDTELDVLVVDVDGRPARPWLTAVLDDHSRALPGYSVWLGAPSALGTSCASGRRSGGRPIRPGRSAASRRSCTSITEATSPAATSARSRSTCTSS
jgi:putative transposase